MKKLTDSFPAKVTAIFLAVLLCYGIVLCGADLVMAYDYGIFTESVSSYFETDNCLYSVQNDAYRLCSQLSEYRPDLFPSDNSENSPNSPNLSLNPDTVSFSLEGQTERLESADIPAAVYYVPEGWQADDTNFRFAAYDTSSGLVYANDRGLLFQLVQTLLEERHSLSESTNLNNLYAQLYQRNAADILVPNTSDATVRTITIDDYVLWAGVAPPVGDADSLMPVRDGYNRAYHLFHLVQTTHNWAAILAVFFILAFFADIIFLCCAAGRRAGHDGPMLNYQDRIPLDLYLCVILFFIVMCIGLVDSFWGGNYLLSLGMTVILLTGAFLLSLSTLLTLCARIKVGKWWCNTVIYQCCCLCWRICRAVFRWTGRMASSLAFTWRVALICAAVMFFNLFCASTGMYGSTVFLFLAVNLGASLAICSATRQIQLLKQAGAALASGVLGQEIDTSRLYGDLRAHGENLNSLNQGMSIALDQKMRSERLKTELITNVSHDIKTPLTSIINYVDLLQKTSDEEQRQQYLTVLDRQAKRLKKLTEDLVEASKASTGNLPVNLSPTNLQEIIDQAIGEYEDRLIAAQLEVVVTLPEKGLSAVADGRLLWRVLDNLLNNACKYAQQGTRVYLDACVRGSLTVISIKNISHQQLNLSPDELMERFVRGDSSRNTEGSGLGLNIAKSLVELQHGHFTLSIDGDLFKAIISLPLYQPEELLEIERTVTFYE